MAFEHLHDSEHGIQKDSAKGREEFERRMEARRLEDEDEEALKPLRRGWCLGSPEFRARMVQDLENRRKNDPGKLSIAARLRKETILSVKDIAARAHLGSYATANANLHSWMQEAKKRQKRKDK